MKKYTMQKRKNSKVFYRVVLIFILPLSSIEGLKTAKRFTFKLDSAYKEEMLQELRRYNFSLLYEITPTTYILAYTGHSKQESNNIVQSLLQSSNGKIIAAEPMRVYKNELTPAIRNPFQSGSTENMLSIKRFSIKVRKNDKIFVFDALKTHNYTWICDITPRLSVFEYMGHLRDFELDRLTGQIKARFKNQIISMEKVTVYENTIKPQEIYEPAPTITSVQEVFKESLETNNYYGMTVSRAHVLGYTGKGVVVAITDVGIDTDNLDLRENIDKGNSYNFINDSKNVTPEFFHNLQDTSVHVTAHGDHCASVIGSVRDNGICTYGISFNATIVGLKIFKVKLYKERYFNLEYGHSTRSDIISRAFVHKLSEIDIFSNAWAPTKSFSALDTSITEAIEYGATKGRHGLGAIYVVPAGPTGNELANNIHTIAVNGIGRHWAKPTDSFISASVITSGLSSGSNISSSFLVTASQQNRCVKSFRGVSAATAEIAAIIALALEANPNLTLRQLKRLLVQASDPEETMHEFSTNAAGHRFHMMFGFGLLNAERLVLLSQKTSPPLPLLKRSFKEASMREIGILAQETEICYNCDVYNSATCLDTLEDVVIRMRITNKCESFKMVLVSPSGTESVLIPHGPVADIRRNTLVQFTSVHFWDEMPFGIWRLQLFYQTQSCRDRIDIQRISLILYGTKTWKAGYQEAQLHGGICAGFNGSEASITTPSEKSPHTPIVVQTDITNSVSVIVIICTVIVIVVFITIHMTNVFFPRNKENLNLISRI